MKLRLPPVFEYQRQALFGIERYAVVEGTTKAGKSWGCLIWLLEEAGRFQKVDANFWWVAPTQAQAEIMYTRTKAMMLAADPNKTCWDSHDTKHRLTIKGCGFLWFKTGEKPDTLYGEDVYAAVMDEFTRQRHEAWIALRTTLSATKGRCRFIGNVKGRQNWGYQWARKAQAGSPNMTYAKITCIDAVRAGIMDQDEVDQAERDLPHDVFRELYYAEASDDGSNPFGLNAIKTCIHPLHSRCRPVAWGWDLARARDWTVGIGLCQHGKVCRFHRWNKTTLPIKATKVRKVGDAHREYWTVTLQKVRELTGDTPALVDSTGPGGPVDMALSAHGQLNIEGYVFSNTSKQHLMEGLAISIQQASIGFPEGIITAELELFGYEYSAGGKVTYCTMEGANDDTVCSLALADECKKRVESGRTKALAFDQEYLEALRSDCRAPASLLRLTTACGWDTELASKVAQHDPACLMASKAKGEANRADGLWSVWCHLDDFDAPPEDHPYIVAISVGSGQAGSPTVLKVGDAETRMVVAEAVLQDTTPEHAAKIACLAGLLFQGPNGRARLIYPHEGPGVAFGETVRRLGYGRVYRMKTEGQGTGDPGWRWSKDGIRTLYSELRNALGAGRYVERSDGTADDARGWVFTDNGTLTTAKLDQESENPRVPSDRIYASMLLSHAMGWAGAIAIKSPKALYGSIAWEEKQREQEKSKKSRYHRRNGEAARQGR